MTQVVAETSAHTETADGSSAALAFLNSLAIFNGLPRRDLADLQRMCTEETYTPGEVIIREGTAGSDLFIIRDGRVRVSIDTPKGARELANFEAGSYFGEMSLFDEYVRSATVTATAPVLVYRMARTQFTRFAMKRPSILFQVCKVLTHRLRGTNTLLTQFSANGD